MPLFEYQCDDCGETFELLVRSETRIACPSCESGKVHKLLSTFAAGSGRREAACAGGSCPMPAPGGPGGCPGGSCPFSG